MPWSIEMRDGKHCVIKDSDGSNEGCHATREEALAQQRALYATESRRASMTTVEIPEGAKVTITIPGLDPEEASEQLREVLTAAVAPLAPPREWFEMEEPNEVTPMTYTADGQAFGHLAPWDQCHAGLAAGAFSECVTAPRSATDYSRFHLGTIETAEGDQIAVGKIVLATGHAPMTADISRATKHYDDTGSVGAFVRARNGQHGIWASGAVRSDLSPEHLRDLRANPVSGDWRSYQGSLELVAALAVPVPGFPIPRAQFAMAASGEIQSLILTDVEEEEPQERSREFIRQREALLAAVLTTKRRDDLPDSAFAIPSRRAYPIMDRSHARNALARSAGKPEESAVRRAVCKRYPDMCKS